MPFLGLKKFMPKPRRQTVQLVDICGYLNKIGTWITGQTIRYGAGQVAHSPVQHAAKVFLGPGL